MSHESLRDIFVPVVSRTKALRLRRLTSQVKLRERDNGVRILQVHNKYRPGWGGEETVVELEAQLLRDNGNDVETVSLWTGELQGANAFKLISAGLGTVWSFRGHRLVREAIERFRPDLMHVHNIFPLFSPSIYWAANAAGIPVVQTLHNYRLACANALLLRDDRPCEACVGRFPWPALLYRCHSSSFFRTLAVTSMNVIHRWVGTYRNKIQAYIALTEFSKDILTRAGLPSERIFVKPNFTPDPGTLVALRSRRVVFAGAINRAKGVHLLLEAWSQLALPGYKLVLLGDGPDRSMLQNRYADDASIEWLGSQPRDTVLEYIATSQWVALPSLAYENFAMSVLEAFSLATPVIVPGHGALATIVSNGRDGLHFSAGDVASLSHTLRSALSSSPSQWAEWSAAARTRYLHNMTSTSNYRQLMGIYQGAMKSFPRRLSPRLEKRFVDGNLEES
jgi:glycosyltransferase involved in cell wall biosynthesis